MTLVARRAVARALRRPLRVLGVAVLATGAVLAYLVLKEPTYQATLHLRLAEGDLTDPTSAPRPPRDVREFIANAALSRYQLEQIMKAHGLSAAWLARDPVSAIEDLRAEIGIEVTRDYFIYDRRRDEPPRSAYVTLSLLGSEPEKTAVVLHAIGQAVLREQAAHRSEDLAYARQVLGAQLARARERARAAQEALVHQRIQASQGGRRRSGAAEARLETLQAESVNAKQQVLALEQRLANMAFSAAAEGQQLGLRLELLDESMVSLSPRLTALKLVFRCVVAFAVALLLAIPALGAFDDRLYAPEDLLPHGIAVFGLLPRFPGDQAGSGGARAPRRAPRAPPDRWGPA